MDVLLMTEKVCIDSYIKTVVFDLHFFSGMELYYKVNLRRLIVSYCCLPRFFFYVLFVLRHLLTNIFFLLFVHVLLILIPIYILY